MNPHAPDLHIDTRRYPIDDRGSTAYGALLDDCRAAMAADGACVLEGFVDTAGVAEIITEVGPHLDRAFFKAKTHNVYLVEDDPAFRPEHPRNRKIDTTSATLGYDAIPKGGLLDGIYRWPALHDFLAAVLGYDTLYPNCDPLSPLNVLVYNPGTTTGWHFDNANFVVTLMLQPAEQGGAYEYAPFIRDEEPETYDRIETIIDGRSDAVKVLRQPAGALVIFQGCRTLHRVTTVAGETPRLVGVFTYSPEPGTALDPHTRMTFYGKVA